MQLIIIGFRCLITCLVTEDLKIVDDWSWPVGVNGMGAICKHQPLYCAQHCHLGWIFVLFRQQRDQTTKGYAPTNLFTAGHLSSKAASEQLKTELSHDGWNSAETSAAREKLGFENVQGAFY